MKKAFEKENICCIFGAGDYFGDEKCPQGAFVIAADGGLKECAKRSITPDVIIGDFDSLGYEAAGETVIRLPVIKDDTDTLAAVKLGLEKGFKRFYLFGGTGGRLSHTIANLQTLTFLARHGAQGFLFDKEEIATVTCSCLGFTQEAKGFVSVFAVDGNAVISEIGLKYTVNEQTLTPAFPLGVSNEFTGAPAIVTVHEGAACIVFPKSEKEYIV